MNFLAARAGVDGSRLLSGSMYAYGQLGADALIQPTIEGWSAEDARLLDILGSKGTGSPEGQALIKDLEAQYGAGNWYPAWVEMQDALTTKYNESLSDAGRLQELQASTTDKDYGQYVPGGAIPYSLHDINAFAAMSAQEQADFLLAFTDPNAAGYFAAASGATKEGVGELMDAARGIKYMGADGNLYATYDEMVAAGQKSPGVVTSVTTSTGEVITDPTRLENLTHEEVFGTPSQPPPPETGGFYPATVDPITGTLPNGMVPEFGTAPSSTTMFPKPNGTAAPVVPSTSLDVVDVTKTGTPVNVKGQPKNIDWNTALVVPAPAPGEDPGDVLPTPVATAGFGGGMLGMLALGGLALAVLAAPKRKR